MSSFNFTHRNLRIALAGAVLTLVGGVAAAGCGGADTSTVEGYCQAQAVADCSYPVVKACYSAADSAIEADTQQCIAKRSLTTYCNPEGLPYHPEFSDNCLSTRAAIFAQDTIDAASMAAVVQACLPVFNRGGTDGTKCTSDTDCDVGNGLLCMVRSGGEGTCRVPQPVNGGESCTNPAAQCPADFHCDAGSHCVANGGLNEACGAGIPCASGLRCSNKVCTTQLPDGSACALDTDCSGGFCIGAGKAAGTCTSAYVFGFGSATCTAFGLP